MNEEQVFQLYERWISQWRRYTSDMPRGDPEPLTAKEAQSTHFEFHGTAALGSFLNFVLANHKEVS